MRDQAFDQVIRAQLESLSLPYVAADWEDMARLIDQTLDTLIRTQLASLRFPITDEAWAEMAVKLDAQFDTRIQKILSSLTLAPTPDDWPIMRAQLAGQLTEVILLKKLARLRASGADTEWKTLERTLDKDVLISEVREKIAALSFPLSPTAWSEMEAYLDGLFDAHVREKIETHAEGVDDVPDWDQFAEKLPFGTFDQAMVQALEGAQLPFEVTDWNALADTLDAPFDAQLRDKLDSWQPTPSEMEWDRLAAALPPAAPVPVRVLPWRRYVAAASVLLLLSTAGMWWQNRKPSFVPFAQKLSKAARPDSQTTDAPRTPLANVPGDAVNQTASTDTQSENTSESPIAPIRGLAVIDPVAEAQPIVSNLQPAQSTAVALVTTGQQATSQQDIEEEKSLPPLRTMPVRQLALASPHLHKFTRFSQIVPPDKRKAEIWLGVVGSLQHTKAELAGPNSTIGNLGGLRIELGINSQWQLISGIQYGGRHFSHEYLTYANKQELAHALDGTMEVVEVPLMMRYRFHPKKEWTLFVEGGIVTVVSLQETYQHYDPQAPANADLRRWTPRLLQPQERAWNLSTYPGNIQVGMGVAYAVTPRWAVQVAPFFQQSLQRTKGSGSLGLEKRLFTTGINVSTVFRLTEPEL